MVNTASPPKRSGFTLIELMFTVMIIGILGGIAAIKYADLYRKAEEGGLQGNLGTIKSAIGIYYADMDGQYSQTLGALTVSARYMKEIPPGRAPNYHALSALETAGTAANDAGGWMYNSDASSSRHGTVLVNCTHTDTKSSSWAAY
ncbi:MAG: prepilin-type N-terminal cleavage/methylation domain-containing protein [Elusimicrobia bacterium]|nr:prepilin-type N-terminal cleavage/methylation domain-containing protein [Elusimicrobiota bacterium]